MVIQWVIVLFCVAGIPLNGRTAITGRWPPVGPYRGAQPPSSGQRVLAGATAALMGGVLILALGTLAAQS